MSRSRNVDVSQRILVYLSTKPRHLYVLLTIVSRMVVKPWLCINLEHLSIELDFLVNVVKVVLKKLHF